MRKGFFLLAAAGFFFIGVSGASAQTAFRFVAWGDTKSDTGVLKSLSVQAKTLNPVLTLYSGDLEGDGFTQTGMDAWKTAVNGGVNNGMFNITFPIRGNHDNHLSGAAANWQNYFNLGAQAAAIGGSNYSALSDDLTYSFDYGNSRFIGFDVPGDITLMSPAQIAWLDQRLTDAENQGLSHAFLFWHGPVYAMDGHCCPTAPSALISVFNKHPILSASFHGHEHILTYANLNTSQISSLTDPFEQFISGDAGAGPNTATSGRYDYWLNLSGANSGGFVTVDVSGSSFTANFYRGGNTTPQWTKTFTKGNAPSPTAGPSPTRTPTPQFTPTRTPTPPISPTRTPTPPVSNYLEAENATLVSSVVENEHAGYTGTGYVNFSLASESSITWNNVQVPSAGQYDLIFRYGLGAADRGVELSVNGYTINSFLSFPSTGTWTNYQELKVQATLNGGANTIKLTTTGADGPNVDHLKPPSGNVNGTPGDGNGDGKVDGQDYIIWLMNYGKTKTGPANGDFNNDSKVDGQDYIIWLMNYGKTPTPVTATPTNSASATITPTKPPAAATNTPTPSTPVTGDCSQAAILCVPTEYSTIAAAITAASAGNTIRVSPGTYTGFSLTKQVTVMAESYNTSDPRQNTAIINGQITSAGSWAYDAGPVVRGFQIIGGTDPVSMNNGPMTLEYNYIHGTGGDAVSFEGGGGIVRGNRIDGSGDDCIDLDNQSKNVIIEDNYILNAHEEGIEMRQQNVTITQRTDIIIRNNRIENSPSDGFQIMDYNNFSNRRYIIERNLFIGNKKGGIAIMPSDITGETLEGAAMPEPMYVVNNTFANNYGAIAGGANAVVINNIFTGQTSFDLKNVNTLSDIKYNLFAATQKLQGTNNFDTATNFVDNPLLNAGYELQSGSAAIDKGIAQLQHTYSYNNTNITDYVINLSSGQYNGSAPDLGWKEF